MKKMIQTIVMAFAAHPEDVVVTCAEGDPCDIYEIRVAQADRKRVAERKEALEKIVSAVSAKQHRRAGIRILD